MIRAGSPESSQTDPLSEDCRQARKQRVCRWLYLLRKAVISGGTRLAMRASSAAEGGALSVASRSPVSSECTVTISGRAQLLCTSMYKRLQCGPA